MNRSLVWLALAVPLLLPGVAAAQRCPFCMQSQVQVQMQWQRQQQQQAHLMALQQRQAQHLMTRQNFGFNQRHTTFQVQRRNTTAMHRLTTSYQQRRTLTTTHRYVSPVRIARTTVTQRRTITYNTHRTILRGSVPGKHYVYRTPIVRARTTRNTTALTAQLHRITTQRRTSLTTRRTTTTTRRNLSSVSRQAVTTNVRRNYVTPRPRTTHNNHDQVRRTTSHSVQHRPTVQLRVRMTNVCGTCHQCKQGQPTVAQLPPRVPFQTAPRQPLVNRPVVQNRPVPGFVIQPPLPAQRPVVGNRPAQRAIARVTMPLQVPALQQPALPPLLTVNRPNLPLKTDDRPSISRPRSPGDDPLLVSRKDRPSDYESVGTKSRTSPLDKEPALPALEGSKTATAPLLGTTAFVSDRPVVQPTWRDDLDPAAVTFAPRLLPLAKAMPGRGLLPNLDGEEIDESGAPAKDALAIKAPPLPPLPQSENP